MSHSGVATGGWGKRVQLRPPTLSRVDPEISTNPMRNNHNWRKGVATTMDLDSDGYFDLCKNKQNHCNQNVFWSQNMAKNALAAGLHPGPRWGSLHCSLDPSSTLGQKDREKKTRRRNVRKEGEGRRIQTVDLHCVSKNISDVFSYNARKQCRIFIISDRNITEKVSNHKI